MLLVIVILRDFFLLIRVLVCNSNSFLTMYFHIPCLRFCLRQLSEYDEMYRTVSRIVLEDYERRYSIISVISHVCVPAIPIVYRRVSARIVT